MTSFSFINGQRSLAFDGDGLGLTPNSFRIADGGCESSVLIGGDRERTSLHPACALFPSLVHQKEKDSGSVLSGSCPKGSDLGRGMQVVPSKLAAFKVQNP